MRRGSGRAVRTNGLPREPALQKRVWLRFQDEVRPAGLVRESVRDSLPAFVG